MNFKLTGLTDDEFDLRVAAICVNHQYQEELVEEDGTIIPNPQTKLDFVLEIIAGFIEDNFVKYLVDSAVETAKADCVQNKVTGKPVLAGTGRND